MIQPIVPKGQYLARPVARSPAHHLTGYCHSRKNRGENTNTNRDRETFYRPAAEHKQQTYRYQCGKAGVEYRRVSFVKTRRNSEARSLSFRRLLFYPLVDENISINGHTNGQNNPGNAGERKRGTKRTE